MNAAPHHARGWRRPSPRECLAAALVSLALAFPACSPGRDSGKGDAPPGSAGAPRPSILLITIDTLRPDHLGCYGYSPYNEPVSPEIDAFARESVRFTRCFAPRAQTMPSLTSMLTGKYPSAHGVLENAQPLDAAQVTLFERLSAKGFDTAAFLAFLPTIAEGNPARGAALVVSGRDTGPGGPRLERQGQWDSNTALQTIRWLRERDSKDARPFFAWVHLYDVHQPYAPPAPDDRRFVGAYAGPLLVREGAPEAEFARVERRLDEAALTRTPLSPEDHAYVTALYDGGVHSTDRHVGAILDALESAGLSKRTIVILAADHGEELGEHESYYFHGNSVYDGALRIPLIVRRPGDGSEGSTNDALVQNLDLAPTILEWAGEAAPPEMEGVSFAKSASRAAAFAEWQDLIVSARTTEWKMIDNPRGAHPKKPPYFGREGGGFRVRCAELYRVGEDPGETRELAALEPAVAESLRALARAHTGRAGGGRTMTPTEDGAISDELRSLGYVGAPKDRGDVVIGAEDCGIPPLH